MLFVLAAQREISWESCQLPGGHLVREVPALPVWNFFGKRCQVISEWAVVMDVLGKGGQCLMCGPQEALFGTTGGWDGSGERWLQQGGW
jgi:hypothetical protein